MNKTIQVHAQRHHEDVLDNGGYFPEAWLIRPFLLSFLTLPFSLPPLTTHSIGLVRQGGSPPHLRL